MATERKITVSFDSEAKRAIAKLTKALEQHRNAYPVTVVNNSPEEQYDEGTLDKVYIALRESGFTPEEIPNIISSIQSKGILFRERR